MASNTSDRPFVNKDTFMELLTSTTIGSILKSSIQSISATDNNIVKSTFNTSKTLSTLSAIFANTTSYYINATTALEEEFCTQPAFHEFPPDLFTSSQRSHGAIILHILLVIYMFVALSIVCDDYFVASLDKVCERLGFSEDVAGATFMAAGSSAPELFTAIIGVFITKGDVGIGTIVGSAVFNILFVIGICGVLIKQAISLSWWPLCRDSIFYALAIIVLILVVADSKVTWYESVIMLLLYGVYIVIMRYNRTIQSIVTDKLKWLTTEKISANGIIGKQLNKFQGDYEQFGDDDDVFHSSTEDNKEDHTEMREFQTTEQTSADNYALNSNIKLTFDEAAFRIMMGHNFKGKCRFIAAARLVVSYHLRMKADSAFLRRQLFKKASRASTMRSYAKSVRNWMSMAYDENIDDWRKLPNIEQDGYLAAAKWFIVYPIKTLLYYTIPDSRKPRWEKYFIATFAMSIVWIFLFSYVTIWMVTYIGYAFSIPDSVMGITFLAAGTSIPDALASVFVAKQGMGDMAVSNCVGSNIFDILLGLSFPWFLKTAIVSPGSTAAINSEGMVYSIILLFLTVLLTVGAVHFSGWMLNKCVGITCLSVYALYVTISVMIECNVFGFVNPPMCVE
ncbi:sodium/potassium/calcium exchanger 4-like [Ruditapes philippinarum]|uniref:sodium/potassium/calcium exchanger 4-like n=1 Tax=Ruditapes philippinarum TaxID=129788 RepID=UPI00295AB680|nr:sodium/potassium/calcium exchanger 4-like [Ruditapes philippinarum]XP_060592771.1 sodium/potassium/calcium exchanger 4-like [Ruditapes philippinarum]XP_060592772.1 sodium/potassium/calcium exchanger 4-like [Ruditapes philippinarum]XP_060592773.1 sodium/potassium/calcium exchanger 4-like [Ruditapes philippinarum]XP_060592774.1 sodium/potassium/calcium exchanger 4-like [Ruditapes philippinarum]